MRILIIILFASLSAFAQSTKISDMPSATSLTGSEIVPIVQTTNKKATILLIRGWGSLGTANQYLRVNAGATGLEFATPLFIVGSTGSTDNAILRASGTGGMTLDAGSPTIDDDGDVLLPTGTLTLRDTRFLVKDKTIDDIFIGNGSGNLTTTGTGANIGVGEGSLAALTTGAANIAVGVVAGDDITTGSANFMLDGGGVTTGSSNIIIKGNAISPTTDNQISIADFVVGNYGSSRWLGLAGHTSTSAEFRLYEDTDNGSNYIGVKPASSVTSTVTYTLPEAPLVNGYVMSSTTGGVMSWILPGDAIIPNGALGTEVNRFVRSIATYNTLSGGSGSGTFISSIPNDSVIEIELVVQGIKSDGSYAYSGRVKGRFRNDGGTTTAIGTSSNDIDESAGGVTWTLTAASPGIDYAFTTGQSGTIKHTIYVEYVITQYP